MYTDDHDAYNKMRLDDPSLPPIDPTPGLSIQTATPMQGGASPKPSENAPLPMVPRGQLASWIAQHQAEEEQTVPSGEPSAEDEQRASISRGIGNATANTLAGIQGTIGILQPGAGNLAQANMAQKQGEQYAQQALGRAPAARAEALQNMQLGAMQDEKRQKQMQMIQALKQQQDSRDPNSDVTKQAKLAKIEQLQNYGAVTQNPALKERFDAMLSLVAAPGMTAERLDQMDKNGDLVKLLGQESNERAMGNANDVKMKIAGATNSLGYAKLAAEEQEKAAALAAKNANVTAKIIGQQPATVTNIAKTALAMKQLGEVQTLLAGPSNPDGLHSNVAKSWWEENVAQKVPLMEGDPHYIEFWSKVEPVNQAMRLAMEKTVKNNPYMAQQLHNTLLNKTDNTATLQTKLQKIPAMLHEVMQQNLSELRVDPETGKTYDKSVLAAHLSDQLGEDTDSVLKNYLSGSGTKKSSPVTTNKAKPAPGSIVVQGGKRYQIQADGSGKEIQ